MKTNKKLSKKTEKRIKKYKENLAHIYKYTQQNSPVDAYVSSMKCINEKCLQGEFEGDKIKSSVEYFKKCLTEA